MILFQNQPNYMKAIWKYDFSSKMPTNAVFSQKHLEIWITPQSYLKMQFPLQSNLNFSSPQHNLKFDFLLKSNLKMQFAPQSNLEIWFSLRCNIKPRPSLKYGNIKIWFSPECYLSSAKQHGNAVSTLKYSFLLKTTWKAT